MVTWEEIDRAIDRIVIEHLELAHVDQPPVEPIRIADALAMTAQLDAALPGRGERRTVNGSSMILIRPDQRPEREHFALAHEIGEEAAVDLLVDRLDLAGPSDRWREELANRFAGRLLCPVHWLRDAVRTVGDDLFELKRVFSTASHEAIARQMLQLDVPTVLTVIDDGVVQRRMGNVPHQQTLDPLENRVWTLCQAGRRSVEESSNSLRVQGWPVHEAGWLREILRTTGLDESP
jgi:predicted transcriptional regulator